MSRVPVRAAAEVHLAMSPEAAFAFLDDVTNLVGLSPQISEVVSIDELGDGYRRVKYRVRTAKGLLTGTTEHVERDGPHRVVLRNELAGVQSIVERTLEPAGDGTRLREVRTVTVLAPGARVFQWLFRRSVRAEQRRFLAALRALVDSR
jgi:carbon monoxide dehydrogenase subunit G